MKEQEPLPEGTFYTSKTVPLIDPTTGERVFFGSTKVLSNTKFNMAPIAGLSPELEAAIEEAKKRG